jgi:hypothetical protein
MKAATDAKPQKTQQKWVLLILTVSGKRPALRMRLWRGLKTVGAADLRDGVYVLPANIEMKSLRALKEIQKDFHEQGGLSYLFNVTTSAELTRNMRELFNRADDYEKLTAEIYALRENSGESPESLWREVRDVRRRFDAIASVDFFPNAASKSCSDLLLNLEAEAARRQTPGEPSVAAASLPVLDRALYQNRLWVTRERLWIDRLASAWLIQRFIDTKARFAWLKDVKKKPADSLGFDFDGAEFTHTERTVSFETLLESFIPDADEGLIRMGRLIHFLDAGGSAVPGAEGVEMILKGIRLESEDDDVVLQKSTVIFDALLEQFRNKK